jgi:hypothetical protein
MQGTAQQAGSFTWNPSVRSLPSVKKLAVRLEGVSDSAFWAVGVQLGDTPSIVAGSAVAAAIGTRVDMKAVTGMSDVGLTIDGTSVKCNPGSSPELSLAVHLTLLPGTELALFRNGALVFQGTPAAGLLFENGRLVSVPVEGKHSVLFRVMLHYMGSGATSPQLSTLPDGTRLVNLKTLRSHLISFSEAGGAESLKSDYQGSMNPTLELTIGTDGSVTSVKARRGGERLLEVYGSTARGWKFQPFVENGSPVAVKALLPFFFSSDGTLKSVLHPSVEAR